MVEEQQRQNMAPSPPCKRQFDADTAATDTSPLPIPRKMIVLALRAPRIQKDNNPTVQNPKIKNAGSNAHRKEQRRWQPSLTPPQMNTTNPTKKNAKSKNLGKVTAVSVYKISDLSCCCCTLFSESICRLKLSGCAVISKGIVVVEGGVSSIRRYLKFLIGRRRLKEKDDEDSVRVVWQGKVAKPSFCKFSILHCTNEVAAWKFFAAHGASHYWDLAVKST